MFTINIKNALISLVVFLTILFTPFHGEPNNETGDISLINNQEISGVSDKLKLGLFGLVSNYYKANQKIFLMRIYFLISDRTMGIFRFLFTQRGIMVLYM